MVPLYAARVEDLGLGDFLKVECGACGHDELIPAIAPLVKGSDYRSHFRAREQRWIAGRKAPPATFHVPMPDRRAG